MVEPEEYRLRRRKILRRFLITFGLIAGTALIYFARQMLAPLFLAFVMAYLAKPLVYALRRKGYSSGLSVFFVAGSLIGFVTLAVGLAIRNMPQGLEITETQVRAEFKLNDMARSFLKVDPAHAEGHSENQPSWVYQKFAKEIDFFMVLLNSKLRISTEEQKALREHYFLKPSEHNQAYRKMLDENLNRSLWPPEVSTDASQILNGDELKTQVSKILSSVSLWIFFPILFFFFLADDGSIFKYLMRFVPNHYFELTITIIERVDRALGHYMRGTALECFLVGLVISLGLFIFGVNFQAAALIGILAGITNAIPFLGTFVGIVAGASYALVAEQINPLLPFIKPDDIFIGVLISVGVAHLLDNAVFQPVFVGKAVNLHPLVVVTAVAAGGVGFGFLGLLLAIPSVVIAKTCLETLVRGLKEYRLI